MKPTIHDFIVTVEAEHQEFIKDMHTLFMDNECLLEIKEAKKGYRVTYAYTVNQKRVALMNYVVRNQEMLVRIYARHIKEYQAFLNTLPENMKQSVANANDCKRLTGLACSPTCTANYHFMMDGVDYKKCKMYAFIWKVEKQSMEYIKEMLKYELGFIQAD